MTTWTKNIFSFLVLILALASCSKEAMWTDCDNDMKVQRTLESEEESELPNLVGTGEGDTDIEQDISDDDDEEDDDDLEDISDDDDEEDDDEAESVKGKK